MWTFQDRSPLSAMTTLSSQGRQQFPSARCVSPRELLGRTAAALLLAESSAGPEHVHEQVVFRPELVVRNSSSTRH